MRICGVLPMVWRMESAFKNVCASRYGRPTGPTGPGRRSSARSGRGARSPGTAGRACSGASRRGTGGRAGRGTRRALFDSSAARHGRLYDGRRTLVAIHLDPEFHGMGSLKRCRSRGQPRPADDSLPRHFPSAVDNDQRKRAGAGKNEGGALLSRASPAASPSATGASAARRSPIIHSVKRARPPLVQVPKGRTGGRSGLHRAAQELTALHREVRIRATETSRRGATRAG